MGIGPGVQQQFKFTPGLMLYETHRIKPWKYLTVGACVGVSEYGAGHIIFIFFLHEPLGTLHLLLVIGNSMLDAVDGTKETKGVSKVQNSIRIMKEKISLLSKRGKKLVKKEKKLKSQLDKFKGAQ